MISYLRFDGLIVRQAQSLDNLRMTYSEHDGGSAERLSLFQGKG